MAKKKDLDSAINDLNKRFGSGTIFKFGVENIVDVPRISTGSLLIDQALGGSKDNSGIALGRMIEIYGENSSGKSTLCLHLLASAQQSGMEIAYIDGEFSFDPIYSQALGLDVGNMFLSQPSNLEDALEITKTLIENGVFVVYDSTNSLPLKAEVTEEVGSHNVGRMGKLYSQICRIVNPLLAENNTSLIWVSQTRANISAVGYQSKVVVGSGKAIAFYSSMRIKTARTGTNKTQGDAYSNKTKVTITKNKVSPPYKEANVEIVFGIGFDRTGEIIDIAVKHDLVKKGGAWYKYIDSEGEILASGQGKINFAIDLEEKPELLEQLRLAVIDKLYE